MFALYFPLLIPGAVKWRGSFNQSHETLDEVTTHGQRAFISFQHEIFSRNPMTNGIRFDR